MFDILLLPLNIYAQISTSVKTAVITAMSTRPAQTPTDHTPVSARLVSMVMAKTVNVSANLKTYWKRFFFKSLCTTNHG